MTRDDARERETVGAGSAGRGRSDGGELGGRRREGEPPPARSQRRRGRPATAEAESTERVAERGAIATRQDIVQ